MRTVLVTGGSRGIGASIVRRFAAQGDSVAFLYHSAHEAARAIEQETGAFGIQADIASPGDVRGAVSQVRERYGGIDVLVNNAAISSFSLLTDLTDEEWGRFMAVNINGAFYTTRAVLPDMIHKKGGRIIQISSMWGQVGSSCEVHYSTTKAALIGFTRALAKEVGPSGITVNCIAPGFIQTEMNQSLTQEIRQAFCDETPLCRLGMPEDVAGCVSFLASEDASFITGQVIGVNGGLVV